MSLELVSNLYGEGITSEPGNRWDQELGSWLQAKKKMCWNNTRLFLMDIILVVNTSSTRLKRAPLIRRECVFSSFFVCASFSSAYRQIMQLFLLKDYQTKIDYITGLITPGSAGINHAIGQDGKVALLTVKLLSTKDKSDLATMKRAARATNKKRFSLSRFGKKEEECHIVA